jgi:plastocyanin
MSDFDHDSDADTKGKTIIHPLRNLCFVIAAAASMLVVQIPWTNAADAAVKIDNFTFDPPSQTIRVGTAATWTNVDDIPHTEVAKSEVFRSCCAGTSPKQCAG